MPPARVQNLNPTVQNSTSVGVQNLNPTKTHSDTDSKTKTQTTTSPPSAPGAARREESVVAQTVLDTPVLPDDTTDTTLCEMVAAGVTRSVAVALLLKYGETLCKRQVDALCLRKARDRAGTLVRAITDGWAIPVPSPGRKRQATLPPIQREPRDEKLEQAWENLSLADRANRETIARRGIRAKPMGERLLQGALGAMLVHQECLAGLTAGQEQKGANNAK